jgi:hypothetical protein
LESLGLDEDRLHSQEQRERQVSVIEGHVPSLETWIVRHRPGFGKADQFFYEEDARAFIKREQGKTHPLWHEEMKLTLGRGHTHGEYVYKCWDCEKFFDSLAHLSLKNLDFSNGLCHLCAIRASQSRAFSSWSYHEDT